MGFAGWHLLATTNAVTRQGSTWQAKVYEDTTDSVSNNNVKLHSDFKLKRGKATTRDKKPGLIPTEIQFSIVDENQALFNRMVDKSDEQFRCLIEKDSSTYFLGNVLLLTTKPEINISKPVIKLKAYEGFARLKQHYDYSGFPQDYQAKTELMRTILNTLDYDSDMRIYQHIGIDNSDIKRELVRIQDYLAVNPEASYYDILEMMCRQLGYEIYQYNGEWIFRQIVSFHYATTPLLTNGVRVFVIDYSDGSMTSDSVSKNQEWTATDLRGPALAIRGKAYSKVIVKQPCFDPLSLPKRHNSLINLGWINGYFNQLDTGWTTGAGSPVFNRGCVRMTNGDNIYQESDEVDASANIVISFNCVVSRMVLDAGDILLEANNELVEVQFHASGSANIYYLRRDTSRWDTSSGSLTFFGVDLYGVDLNGTYAEEYSVNTLEKRIELPAPAEAGTVKIILKGGGSVSGNSYPGEFVQHNYATVELQEINNHDIQVPASYIVSAEISSDIVRTLELEIPFSDLDPFNVNFWRYEYDPGTGYEYFRVYEWDDRAGTTYTLMKHLAIEFLEYHQDNAGLDLKLLPGTSGGFDNLIYGDIDGNGTRYYLPVYEEGMLIEDQRRFILLEHKEASISPTVKQYYEYNANATSSRGGVPSMGAYSISYTGSKTISLKQRYVKIVPVAFDTDFTSGIIYRKDLLDVRLLKIELHVTTAFDAAATMLIKHNTTDIFTAARANLQRVRSNDQGYYLELSSGDYLQVTFTLNGATTGEGYILLYIEARG